MLLDALHRAVTRLCLEGRHVLVAVSGGIDSSVLLEGLSRMAGECNLTLSVGHVHHGLRGAEADADEDSVRERADCLGLPYSAERIDPLALRTGASNRTRPTLQEAARILRYEALGRIARLHSADHIATAHNLDDQAETVLMRLLRGTAPGGLGGIPECSEDGLLVRPLLGVTREEIEAFAAQAGIAWREDRSNTSDAYTRNRLRLHWIPELAQEFNPQLLRSIGRLAESQRRDAEWIKGLVDEASSRLWAQKESGTVGELMEGRYLELVDSGWEDLPEALALRLARRAMHDLGAGRDVSRIHLERIWAFLRRNDRAPGSQLELPGGLRVFRVPGGFRMGRIKVDG